MRSPLSIRRALDIAAPFTVYRAIGRRPSAVYVDEVRHPVADSPDMPHRLWDMVFEEYVAQVGDQLQDGQGSLMLLTESGDFHRVQITPPQPRSLHDPFTHADRTLAADWARIEVLMAEGRLTAGRVQRSRQMPFDAAQVKFADDQPLVVQTRSA